MGERVEDADLDIWMRVERREVGIAILEVDVVDQDAHAHAAVGGAKQVSGEEQAGGIRIPLEVLHVETSFGQVGQHDARRERFAPAPDDREPGLARVLRGERGNFAADRRGFVGLEGGRLGARIVLRHRGAAADRHDGGDQQGAYAQHRRAQAMFTRALCATASTRFRSPTDSLRTCWVDHARCSEKPLFG